MFRRLRLRLMLVNLGVIFILFCLLTSGTYWFVQERMTEGRTHMMNRLAEEVLSGRREGPPQPPPPGAPPWRGPLLFFATVNTAGVLTDTSPYVPLSFRQLMQAIRLAEVSAPGATLTLDNQSAYAFLKLPLPDHAGMLFVFHDYQRDQETLHLLLSTLALVAVACMILSLAGSYFMANRAMAPIQQAWQQQRDFLADASHELRTPLAVIRTNLDVIRDAPSETVDSQYQWLDNIDEEVKQMTQMVESLLFLSQADSRQQLVKKELFAMDQAVLAATGLFLPLAAAKQIQLVTQIGQDIFCYGDEAKLKQTIAILLDNAIRHTPAGGRIAVSLSVAPRQQLALSVKDSGEGILPAEMEKIFLRFYQSDASRSTGGAGLGLAIAKWIVESHAGKIKVTSQYGQGAEFTVLLPLAAAPVN
ncbi:MAG: ATP-binding protein [Sporomusaceae bacterium]|nr:ATP-binding protein [Sporomusaceae bacterium]